MSVTHFQLKDGPQETHAHLPSPLPRHCRTTGSSPHVLFFFLRVQVNVGFFLTGLSPVFAGINFISDTGKKVSLGNVFKAY